MRAQGPTRAPLRQRLHSKHHSSLLNLPNILILVCFLVFTWTLCRAATLAQQGPGRADQSAGAALPSLEELYGPKEGLWPRSAASGPNQLLVLSYYSSKASLVARLLMLLGVYAGEASQLRIEASDKLRWWELHQLTTLNDLMLQQHASPGLPHHLARGFHVSALSKQEQDYYQDRLAGIVKYLGRHKPWLLKDPRMSWLAPLWLEQLESPLCVLVVDMQPDRLAQHLAEQQQQRQLRRQQQQLSGSSELEVSPATHLERWTNATLSSLKACFGVPTVIIPSSVLQPPLVEAFTLVLAQHLTAAGVQGVRVPPPDLLQQQFLTHFRPDARTASHCSAAADNSTASDGAALLAQACNWLPSKPHTGSAGAQEGSGTSGPDASMLPLPTQALLSALHDHLTAHLAHPADSPLQYSRTAGQVYSTYASTVKQLVAQGGGSHPRSGDHHGIGALIVEALKHVENTVVAATARARQRSRMLVATA